MSVIELGERLVDLDRRAVLSDRGSVPLSPLEAEFLGYLARADGRVVGREELLREVWDYREGVVSRAVDHAVRRLRPKLEPEPRSPRHLVSVYGGGYRLDGVRRPDPLFVGRRRELYALRHALVRSRWVSLVGPGGVGKTTLARQLAQDASAPTLWCDVRDARSSAALLRLLAGALELPVEADAGRIARALAARGALLVVLDNLEQLPEEAEATVAGLVRRAPELRLLGTTRRALGSSDELAVDLEPMQAAEARALFRLRAGPEGAGDWSNEQIDRLVERLDQLPLAIELAASRAELVAPEQLLEMLDRRFVLLGSSDRGLEATLQWSWELLHDDERAALARCSVFAGDFDALAAEAVLGLDVPFVVDLLGGLRRKSLLTLSKRRFGMLESVAAFAAARLDPEVREACELRHIEYFVELSARRAVMSESTELLHAWARAVELRPAGALHLAQALEPWLMASSSTARRREIWTRTLQALGSDPSRERGIALIRLAEAERGSGHSAEAEQLLALAEPLLEGTEEEDTLSMTRGLLHLGAGRPAEAQRELERSADQARRHRRRRGECIARASVGHAHWIQGELAAAERCYRDALAVARSEGLDGLIVNVEGYLANLLMERGELAEARTRFEDVCSREIVGGNAVARIAALTNLGALGIEQGMHEEAEQQLEAAAALARRLAERSQEGIALGNLGILRLVQGRGEEAADLLALAADAVQGAIDPRLGAYLAAFRGDFGASEEELRRLGDSDGLLLVEVLRGGSPPSQELEEASARSSDLRIARLVVAARS